MSPRTIGLLSTLAVLVVLASTIILISRQSSAVSSNDIQVNTDTIKLDKSRSLAYASSAESARGNSLPIMSEGETAGGTKNAPETAAMPQTTNTENNSPASTPAESTSGSSEASTPRQSSPAQSTSTQPEWNTPSQSAQDTSASQQDNTRPSLIGMLDSTIHNLFN